jgi:hypothetical protein
VIAATRELRALYPTQTAFAAALKGPDGITSFTQFTVCKALQGAPMGFTFARAIAQLKGVTVEALMSGAPTHVVHVGRRHESLPGWSEAAAELVARDFAPPHAVRGAGVALVSFPPAKVNLPYAYDVTMNWIRHAAPEVRAAAEAVAVGAAKLRW